MGFLVRLDFRFWNRGLEFGVRRSGFVRPHVRLVLHSLIDIPTGGRLLNECHTTAEHARETAYRRTNHLAPITRRKMGRRGGRPSLKEGDSGTQRARTPLLHFGAGDPARGGHRWGRIRGSQNEGQVKISRVSVNRDSKPPRTHPVEPVKNHMFSSAFIANFLSCHRLTLVCRSPKYLP